MKTCIIEWAKLSTDQKFKYLEESRFLKDKYLKALHEWEASLHNSTNKQIALIDERRKQRDTVDFTMSMFSGFGDPGMTLEGAESCFSDHSAENPEIIDETTKEPHLDEEVDLEL